MPKMRAFIGCLLMSGSVFASLNIPGIPMQSISPLAANDKTLARTGLAINEDEVVSGEDPAQLKLSEKQLHESKVWGLTEDEEKRYVQLMQSRSGLYYKGLNLTPIDILGINARSDIERNHFAQLGAAQEAQKVSKNIAWNNAFYKAYSDLFQNVPVVDPDFDPTPFAPMAYKPVVLNQGDHLHLFIKADDAIKTVLMTLIDAIDNTANTQLNILLLNMSDTDIQLWANQQQIPQALVAAGRINLNHGELSFEGLTGTKKSTPLLLLSRGNASSRVDLGRF